MFHNRSKSLIYCAYVTPDSIYTERYMSLPDSNPDGYVTASISNVSAFADADFLLAHGTGDDNVHFANSAHLLDMFTQAGIKSFRFRMFTDRLVFPTFLLMPACTLRASFDLCMYICVLLT